MGRRIAGIGRAIAVIALLGGCAADRVDDAPPPVAEPSAAVAEQPPEPTMDVEPIAVNSLPFAVNTSMFTSTPAAAFAESPQGWLTYAILLPADDNDRNFSLILTAYDQPPPEDRRGTFREGQLNLGQLRRAVTENADVRLVDRVLTEMWGGELSLFVTTELAEAYEDVPPINLDSVEMLPLRGPGRKQCLNIAWIAPDLSESITGLLCELMDPGEQPMNRQEAMALLEELDFHRR